MTTPIKVAVVGAAGRMGLETVRAMDSDPQFELVSAVGRSNLGADIRKLAGSTLPPLALEGNLEEALESSNPEVVIDLSHYSAALEHAQITSKRQIPIILGMTGISRETLVEIDGLCRRSQTPGMYVPNFAIGAVLMMHFAELAAKWLPDAEVIEFHHERKEDAPSGTAYLTAERIGAARVRPTTPLPTPIMKADGARGGIVNGVPVHSVRLPGLLAHQEVLFGGPGETLTIRHDSLDRKSFMQGVKLCASVVQSMSGLTIGLDKILF